MGNFVARPQANLYDRSVGVSPCPDAAREGERQSLISAFAQSLTSDLLVKSGIRQGMTVVNVGSLTGDVAFLLAERVGPSGRVIAIETDARLAGVARERASEQCFGNIAFDCLDVRDLRLESMADAVIGRFYLGGQPDPADTVRRAAALVRPGGAVVFQEWDYRALRGADSRLPVYARFIEKAAGVLIRNGVRPDMGLRLVDAYVEAGLAIPSIRTEVSPVIGEGDRGYRLLQALFGIDGNPELTERLLAEATLAGVHAYFPMQVGAWVRR